MASSRGYGNCTEVTDFCTVEASTFGYRPNLAGNTILLVVFGLCTLAQMILAVWKRTISFGVVVLIGTLLEVIGYAGRIILYDNVWSSAGMTIQAVCLIIAPSFLAAGVYVTLKHIVMYLGPQHSRLRPVYWVWLFVGGDILAVLLQAAGGGMGSAAKSKDALDTGNNIMIGGLIVGVVFQCLCIVLVLDFGQTIWRKKRNGTYESMADSSQTSPVGFRFYMICTSLAFLLIFIRSIYRVPELVGGWGNERMRKEAEFMILDGMMIALACILLAVAHPGIFLPAISSKHIRRNEASTEKRPKRSDVESS